MENLHIPITGDSSNFRSALQSARDGVRQTAKQIEDSGMTIEQMFDRIKVAAAASLAGFSVKEFASKVMEVRGEFQKLEVAFNTMLGSAEKADALMQQLVKTAAITPFDLKGVADGAKQLMAYGIAADEVNDTLIHLGDIAAGLSLPLGDLVYLYGTTMTQGRMFTQDLRQFMGRGIPLAEELAKQFGVTKDKVGELVTAGKVGAEEFKKAIMAMSSEGGRFGGLMEEQSKTITGQISNIEDAIDVMFNNIGKQSEGIINGSLSAISSLVENYETVGRVIMGLVVTYGVYKTAVMTVTALESFRTKNLALQAVGVQGVTAAEAIHYHWLVLVQKAQALLNATMLANPYVAVATAVAAVTAALISLGSEQDRVNAAYDEYMRKRDEAIAKEEEHRRKIEQLIQIAGDESLSTDTRRKALLKLEEKYPDIFKKYATEIEMLKHIRDIKAEIAILDGKTSIANPVNELAEIDKRIAELQKKGAWSLSSTNSYAGTHSSSRTRSEEEELQQKLRRRRELAKEIERDRGETYLTNLTGVSNGSLQLQINERRKLLKEIEAREKLVKKDVTVTGRVKLGGATGVYNKQEIQAQLQNLEREQERRAQIIADGSKNFVAEANKAYAEQKVALQQLEALHDPLKRAASDMTIDGKKVKDMGSDEFLAAIEKQQKAVDEAKKKVDAYNKARNGGSASTSKQDSAAKEDAARREREFEQELSDRERQAKQLEAMKDAQTAATIANEQNRSRRELMQIEKDHDDALAAIDRQAEEMRKANYEAEKKAWEAANTDKTKSWSDTATAKDVEANGYANIQLTQEQMATLKALRDKENADYARSVKERFDAERQSMLDYLQEYGTYQQQRLAIAEEYSKKIAEAEASGNKWEAKRLTAERDSRIAQANAQSLAMNIDWNQTFQGIGNVLQDIAKETLQKVNDYMGTAEFKGLDAAAKKAYTDLKQQLIDAGGQTASNPFSSSTWDEIAKLTDEYKFHVKALADASETHTNAVADYQKAVEKEKAARADLDKAIKNQAAHLGKTDQGEYDDAVSRARENLANATQDVADTFQQMQESGEAVQQQQTNVSNTQQNLHQKTEAAAQGMNNFNTVLGQITSGSLKGFADGVANIIMAITGSKHQMEGVVGLFGDAGKKIGGIVGAILSIIDMLGEKPVEFFDNLFDGISKVIEEVIAHIPEIIESVVKGVGNVVGGLFSGIIRLFGSDFIDNSPYEEALAKWNYVLDSWEDTVKYERELIERYYGASAISASRKAIEAAENAMKAAKEVYKGWAASGAGIFSHSNGYKSNNSANWDALWRYDLEVSAKVSKDVANLFRLGWEELERLKNEVPAFWSSLKDEAKEYLDQYIEAGKTTAETIDALNEKLTTTTKENVVDDFLSSFYDLADGSESVMNDVASNWQKMLNRMVINNIVGSEFQSKLEAWYQRLARLQEQYSEGQITSALYRRRTENLMAQYDSITEEAQAKVNRLIEQGVLRPIDEASREVFDNLRSSFASVLTDMEGDASDFGKNVSKILYEALVERFVLNSEFDTWLKGWSERYTAAIAGNYEVDGKAMTQEEYDQRKAQLEADLKEYEEFKEKLKEIAGEGWENFDINTEYAFWGKQSMAAKMLKLLEQWEQTGEFDTRYWAWLQDLGFGEGYNNIIKSLEAIKLAEQKLNELLAAGSITEEERAERIAALNKEREEEIAKLKELAVVYADMTNWTTEQKIDASPLADVGDSLISALQDTSKSVDDWKKEIIDSLTNDLIKQIVYNDDFKDKIRAIQERYIALFEPDEDGNKLTPEQIAAEIEKISSELAGIMTEAEKQVEGIKTIIPDIDTTPFENVRDTFLDTLTDIEGDAEKFKEDLVKILTKDLIEKLVLDVPLTLDVTRRGEDGTIGKIEGKAYDNFNAYSDDWNKAYLDGMKELQEAQKALNEARASGDEEAIAAAEAHYNAASAYIDTLIDELVALEVMTAEEAKKFTERMKKAAQDTTFTDMESNFVSALMDMEGDVKDFANDIKKTIVQKLVEAFMVSEKIKPLLDDLQNTFNYAMGLTFEGLSTKEATKERAKVINDGYTDENGKEHKGVNDIADELEPLKLVLNELLTAMGYVSKEGETLFSNLGDTILESLLDVGSGVEDFMDSITQTITEDLVKSYMATDEFQEGLKTVKDDLEAAVKALADAKTPEEIAAAEEQLKNAKKAAEDFYNEAVDGTKRFTDALRKIETDTTFKNMTDGWVSNLMDFNATAEDWAEEIGRTMAQRIIQQMIVPTMIQPFLDSLNDAFNAAMVANTTSDENGNAVYNWEGIFDNEGLKAALDALMKQYPEAREAVQKIMSLAGLKPETSNALDSLGDTLIDRLLSLDDDVEEIGKQIGQTLIREMLQQMLATGGYADQIAKFKEIWQNILTSDGGQWTDENGMVWTLETLLAGIAKLEDDIAKDASFSTLIDKAKEFGSAAKEGFSDLRGAFVSALLDMNGDAESFGKQIGRTMLEQMLDAYIDNKWKDEIKALNQEWAEALESGNTEAIEHIKQKVKQLYEAIGNDVEVIDIAAAIKELDKQLDTTFSDMADSWASALMDMEGTAEDWAQSVGKMIAEKIIKSMVIPTMIQPLLNDMQKAWNAAAEQEGATYQTMLDAMMPYLSDLVGAYEELRPIADYILNSLGVYKEVVEELKEEVEYALQDMKDNFVSDLMDMEATAEKRAESISRIIAENFIKNFVLGDAFDAQMEQWQQHYESILNSGLSEDERARQLKLLRDAIASAKEGYVEQAMAIQELLGLNATNSNQTATANIADKITYEQADMGLGMLMALVMNSEQMLATVRGGVTVFNGGDAASYQAKMATANGEETGRQIESMLLGLANLNIPDGDTVREIRGLIIIGNSYLYDIKTSNEQMLRQFGERLESIDNKIGQIF